MAELDIGKTKVSSINPNKTASFDSISGNLPKRIQLQFKVICNAFVDLCDSCQNSFPLSLAPTLEQVLDAQTNLVSAPFQEQQNFLKTVHQALINSQKELPQTAASEVENWLTIARIYLGNGEDSGAA